MYIVTNPVLSDSLIILQYTSVLLLTNMVNMTNMVDIMPLKNIIKHR